MPLYSILKTVRNYIILYSLNYFTLHGQKSHCLDLNREINYDWIFIAVIIMFLACYLFVISSSNTD